MIKLSAHFGSEVMAKKVEKHVKRTILYSEELNTADIIKVLYNYRVSINILKAYLILSDKVIPKNILAIMIRAKLVVLCIRSSQVRKINCTKSQY